MTLQRRYKHPRVHLPQANRHLIIRFSNSNKILAIRSNRADNLAMRDQNFLVHQGIAFNAIDVQLRLTAAQVEDIVVEVKAG